MKGVNHCLLSVQRKEHLRKGVPRGVGIPNDPVQVSWRKFATGMRVGGYAMPFQEREYAPRPPDPSTHHRQHVLGRVLQSPVSTGEGM